MYGGAAMASESGSAFARERGRECECELELDCTGADDDDDDDDDDVFAGWLACEDVCPTEPEGVKIRSLLSASQPACLLPAGDSIQKDGSSKETAKQASKRASTCSGLP